MKIQKGNTGLVNVSRYSANQCLSGGAFSTCLTIHADATISCFLGHWAVTGKATSYHLPLAAARSPAHRMLSVAQTRDLGVVGVVTGAGEGAGPRKARSGLLVFCDF